MPSRLRNLPGLGDDVAGWYAVKEGAKKQAGLAMELSLSYQISIDRACLRLGRIYHLFATNRH